MIRGLVKPAVQAGRSFKQRGALGIKRALNGGKLGGQACGLNRARLLANAVAAMSDSLPPPVKASGRIEARTGPSNDADVSLI